MTRRKDDLIIGTCCTVAGGLGIIGSVALLLLAGVSSGPIGPMSGIVLALGIWVLLGDRL